jgi:signal transduction histidine kinase
LSLLGSSWPWRSLAYLASGVPEGIVVLVAIPVLTGAGLALAPVGIGVALLLGACLIGVPVAAVERLRLRLVGPRPTPGPHQPPKRPGPAGWLSTRLREAATWQELAFAVLIGVLLWVVDLAVLAFAVVLTGVTLFAPLIVAVAPESSVRAGLRLHGAIWLVPLLGVVVAVGMAYLVTAAAGTRAALARAVLPAAAARADARLVEVTRSRSRLMDGFDNERRRIERDLHDGVQQRLLALSVNLGLVRMELAGGADPSALAPLVAGAHEQSKAVLGELRELVRGIHPQILAERGLAAAIADLAGRSGVAVRTDISTLSRFPRQVESTAYFVVSEALANVDRHSGARLATVSARLDRDLLVVEIRDDGTGGADPARGSGLQGLADRADAVGGRFLLASPPGGPTVLRLEVPCG